MKMMTVAAAISVAIRISSSRSRMRSSMLSLPPGAAHIVAVVPGRGVAEVPPRGIFGPVRRGAQGLRRVRAVAVCTRHRSEAYESVESAEAPQGYPPARWRGGWRAKRAGWEDYTCSVLV